MSLTRRLLANVLNSLPPEWPVDPQPAITAALQARREKVVVLDDDPTGTQTVYGVPVLTEWSVPALQTELLNDLPVCFVLTNSRSLPLAQAQALNADIGHHLRQAAQLTGKAFVVVSRSDSTLRGHFPGEVDALATALGEALDAWLLVPFFLEGGRYTIDDTHYVAEGEVLVPAGETEFARDAAFGYSASNLRQWVAEKTAGRIPAEAVTSVSLDDLRRGGPERVAERLLALQHGTVCAINAASRRDLDVFTHGLLLAEARGKRFLYRTAASFVQARAGIASRPLLTRSDMITADAGGGLVVVGSHVPRTTSQLEHLLRLPEVTPVEIDVGTLLVDSARAAAITRLAHEVEAGLKRDRDVVLFTSRQLVTGADAASSLSIGQRVSEGLVAIVQALTTRPRYILAKGGITSSDVATRGLGVRRALVLGQILPGVPVWQLGPETRYPGLSYVVFPGNVGGPEALGQIITALRPQRKGHSVPLC
jgi:uncharacterized protein YgbK (DUF1537 family)